MFVLTYPSCLLGIVFDTCVCERCAFFDVSSTQILLGIVFDTCVCERCALFDVSFTSVSMGIVFDTCVRIGRISILFAGYRFPRHSFRFFSSALMGIVFDTYVSMGRVTRLRRVSFSIPKLVRVISSVFIGYRFRYLHLYRAHFSCLMGIVFDTYVSMWRVTRLRRELFSTPMFA